MTPGRLIFAEPLKDTPPIVLAFAKVVAVAASATAMLALPSNEVPPIVLALANAVAVAAKPVHDPELPEVFPVTFPVTFPVKIPINPVAVTFPVLGLYFKSPSDSNPKLPPSRSPPAVNIIAFSSLVASLSVIATVVATVATAAVPDVS